MQASTPFPIIPFSAQPGEFPRITEMSFLSVPRETFVRGQNTIQSLIQEVSAVSWLDDLSKVRECNRSWRWPLSNDFIRTECVQY